MNQRKDAKHHALPFPERDQSRKKEKGRKIIHCRRRSSSKKEGTVMDASFQDELPLFRLTFAVERGASLDFELRLIQTNECSFQALKNRCVISSCGNPAEPDSVYCSEQCIVKHAEESLVALEKAQQMRFGSKAVSFSVLS